MVGKSIIRRAQVKSARNDDLPNDVDI